MLLVHVGDAEVIEADGFPDGGRGGGGRTRGLRFLLGMRERTGDGRSDEEKENEKARKAKKRLNRIHRISLSAGRSNRAKVATNRRAVLLNSPEHDYRIRRRVYISAGRVGIGLNGRRKLTRARMESGEE
jgi:hypothetical protein